MIQTIVVDDEPLLRKNIKNSIESTNSNFQVIAEARNGMQAYELIKELHPDVVFLDIRMPVMDGISLLDKLHQNHINPIRVILSGYSDFEYAKKAIQYKVFDYVLKPIHLEQLEQLLNSIADRILMKKSNAEYEFLNYTFKGTKPSVPLETLSASMQSYREYYCFYLTVGSYMYTKNNQFNPNREIPEAENFPARISDYCSSSEQVWSVSGENQNETLLIIGRTTTGDFSARRIAEHIYQEAAALHLPVTLVYSPAACHLDLIKETAINLKYASIWKIRFGHSSLIEVKDFSDIEPSAAVLSSEQISVFEKCIQEKRYHDYQKHVREIMHSFSEKKIYQHQLKIELIRILEILQNNYLSQEMQDFVNESISNSRSYDDINEIMKQYIDDHSKDYYSTLSPDTTGLIRDYIDEYYDTQLSLKEIAAHFHVSPSYLSTLFKKAYSISPNEYVMAKRIAKAKDLLSVFPPVSIKQIALMIGYTDPFYFSRIFKMATGLTPTEYRDEHYHNA